MYDFLMISSTTNGVYVRSTDPKIGDTLFTELSKHIKNPQAVVEAKTISGQPYAWKFSNLAGKDGDTAWLMMTQLSNSGWEPMGFNAAIDKYQFRRKRG